MVYYLLHIKQSFVFYSILLKKEIVRWYDYVYQARAGKLFRRGFMTL